MNGLSVRTIENLSRAIDGHSLVCCPTVHGAGFVIISVTGDDFFFFCAELKCFSKDALQV